MDASFESIPEQGESSRKRRNREHTNSRSGCAQCKARKVKASIPTTILPLRTWCLTALNSATRKSPNVEPVLDVALFAHTPLRSMACISSQVQQVRPRPNIRCPLRTVYPIITSALHPFSRNLVLRPSQKNSPSALQPSRQINLVLHSLLCSRSFGRQILRMRSFGHITLRGQRTWCLERWICHHRRSI